MAFDRGYVVTCRRLLFPQPACVNVRSAALAVLPANHDASISAIADCCSDRGGDRFLAGSLPPGARCEPQPPRIETPAAETSANSQCRQDAGLRVGLRPLLLPKQSGAETAGLTAIFFPLLPPPGGWSFPDLRRLASRVSPPPMLARAYRFFSGPVTRVRESPCNSWPDKPLLCHGFLTPHRSMESCETIQQE